MGPRGSDARRYIVCASVWGRDFRVWGLGFREKGFGFRVQGAGLYDIVLQVWDA